MINFIIPVFCYDDSFIFVNTDNLFIAIDNSYNNRLILEQCLYTILTDNVACLICGC